jgi:serine/threonine protein kinase
VSRPASNPPAISGYTPIELIGTGGYADVFLYEQHMPNRRVAVKVLVGDSLSGDTQRRQFAAEANLMAKVSTHPYIVSIFQADVAADGRPYLVMEYYPGDNFLRRVRREQFSVADVLRVGVQVGSAIETAHRAGILHRDIKPANILTSEFRRPGLTDFGIASTQGPDAEETEGVSIPWSPPEAFGAGDLDARADVYSLAATLFHLLAGRSPFEMPGGDNSALGLMSRIERAPVPSIGRPDAPQSLQRVLAQAMAKDPAHRPASVADFVRQLQGVEAEMKLSVTPLEVADDGSSVRSRTTVDDDDATRIKGVTEIRAQAPVTAIDSVPAQPVVTGQIADRRREGLLAEPEISDTIHRAPAAPPASATAEAPKRTLTWAIAGGAVLVVLAAVAVLALRSADSGDETATSTTLAFGEQSGARAVEPIQPVVNVVGEVQPDGSVLFTWDAPGHQAGDAYDLVQQAGADVVDLGSTAELSKSVSGGAGEICLEVTAVRQLTSPAIPVKGCVTL